MQQPVRGSWVMDHDYDVAPEVLARMPARVVGPLPQFDQILQSKNPQFLYRPDGRVRGVYVEAVIDEQGRVGKVRMSRGLGDAQARAVEEAARAWRFSPAKRRGQPVPAVVMIEVPLGSVSR